MRLIKVFLGGYTNYTNAQNLNCRALAQHLDKDKFAIYTLELYSGKLSSIKGKGISVFRCFRPHRISIYLAYLWGIWNCDIAFLPKGEVWRFNRFLLRLFRKKSFSTLEGILDEKNLQSAVQVQGSYKNLMKSYSFFDKVYPITTFLGKYNSTNHNLTCEIEPLYLGTDTGPFLNKRQPEQQLSTIIYIGRLMERKGIYDYLQLAQTFPEFQFLIAGDGPEKQNIEKLIQDDNLKNTKMLGVLPHDQLADVLTEVQLHILPSRSEGFPKVTLETAAAGVPSIVYADYGAEEWITNDKNGWVVKALDDIIAIIKNIKNNPEMLHRVSVDSTILAESFDWKIRVKDWEEVIKKII